MDTTCFQCGKTFNRQKYINGENAFFCSIECYIEYQEKSHETEMKEREALQKHYAGLTDSGKTIFLLQKICRKMGIDTPL